MYRKNPNDHHDSDLTVALQARKAPPPTVRYPPWPQGITKIVDLPDPTPEQIEERINLFRKVVEEAQFQRLRWYGRDGKQHSQMVDTFSASIVMNVFNTLNEKNKMTFANMEPNQIVRVVMKLGKN